MGDGRILIKPWLTIPLKKSYRMSLISAGSISLDSAFKVENIFNSFNESMGNKAGRQVIYQRTLINIIYPTRFHLNRMENGKDAAHERSIFEVEVLI